MTIRLHFLVEGRTEYNFVNQLLKTQLEENSIYVTVSMLETKRDEKLGRKYSGGSPLYEKVKREIQLFLKDQSPDFYLTTMIDLYKFPKGFPTFDELIQSPYKRVEKMETKFYNDLNDPRFLPYIQLHEYEALLFSNPNKFSEIFENVGKGVTNLIKILSAKRPEEINDGDNTAPSKRIIKEIPKYKFEKSSAGAIVAEHIGIDLLREKCPHFNSWISKLEDLQND